MALDEFSCLWVVELKILLVIVKRQLEPLPKLRLHWIDHVFDASADEDSMNRKSRSCQEVNVTVVASWNTHLVWISSHSTIGCCSL